MTTTQQRQQLAIIWGAMLAAIVLYGVVAIVVAPTVSPAASAEVDWLRRLLSGAAVLTGALSVWWRRHFLPSAPQSSARPDFAAVQRHAVIAWALSEAVAVCGLVAALLLGDAREYVPFGAGAAALLLLHRPASLPTAVPRTP